MKVNDAAVAQGDSHGVDIDEGEGGYKMLMVGV